MVYAGPSEYFGTKGRVGHINETLHRVTDTLF